MVAMEKALGLLLTASAVMMSSATLAQTPQPFPRPASDRTAQAPAAPATAAAPPAATAPDPATAPSEAVLGVPVPPGAQFIASYDAGRAQRYYIFGASAPYAELVTYYRTALKDRGDQVYAQPATHVFETGRFRDETMAFPPSVTIKDWTSGGSAGYPNPRPQGQPDRFPTIIMIVPAPPAAAR